MEGCDWKNPNCNVPGCISKCGQLSWFGNLSECTVVLQYKVPQEDEWRSLGMYHPGEHLDLGNGALWLPHDARLRVLQIPRQGTDLKNPKLVVEFGQIGSGLPDLYVDQSMCQEAPQVLPSETPTPQLPRSRSLSAALPTRPVAVVPDSTKILILFVSLLLLFVIVVAWKIIQICK